MEQTENPNTKKRFRITPNHITILRILGTIALLPMKPFTLAWFILYGVTGATDVIDGALARATNQTTKLGAHLDSIADILLYTVILLKVLPELARLLPPWIWWIVAGVGFLRLLVYIFAALKFHQMASIHTYLNKITSFATFMLPYFIHTPILLGYSFFILGAWLLSTLEEFLIHLLSDKCVPRLHIFSLLKERRDGRGL